MRAESQKEIADDLFTENGETSALLRSYDWSQTPLGPIETWSEGLKTAVQSHLTKLNHAQSPALVHQQASVPPQNCIQTDALRASETKYRMLFESIDQGFCLCELLFDENGEPHDYRFLEVNPAFERLTGLEQVIGKTALELIPNHDTHWFEIFGKVVRTREPVRFEEQTRAINRWFDVNAFCLGEPQSHQFAALFTNITERKRIEAERQQAEAALRQSEEKYRQLFESIDEGFCTIEVLFDVDGKPVDHRILQANPAFERQSGIANPEGKTASELAPELEQYWNDLYAQVINTGESIRTEVRSDALDRWFDVLVSRIGDAATRQVAIVFTDISDRKRAEIALQQASAELESQVRKFDATLSTISDCVFSFDRDGRFLYANQVLLDLWGVTAAEAIDKTMADLNYPADVEQQVLDDLRRVFETRESVRNETPYTTPAGVEGYFEYILSPVFAADRTVESVVGLSRDVSDRKRVEAALRQSEEQSRNILESIAESFFALDQDWRFTYMNQSAEALLDRSPGDLIGKNIWDEYPGLAGNELEPVYRGAMRDRVIQSLTAFYPDHDRWYEVRTYPAANGIAVYFNNVTDRKAAEAEREQLLQQEQAAREDAERANRIKDEFLAVLSHELRSPLNPILGWTQLLRNGKLAPARQMDALATIERNAKLQAQLIEDLLDISRIMQGKLALTATPVSLAFVIAAAVETVRLAADAKTIQITLDLDPDVAPVSGDAARLQQVVWNLLTNAVKFTDSGGQVTVQLSRVAEGSLGNAIAQIRVIDTGKGINPQFLPHVFEYFRQEDGSTTRRFGGLGLGLAIVRQIVELHGGTVKAESRGEHQGATFIVQLPMLQASLTDLEPTQAQATSDMHLQHVQILLVDDDTDTREFEAFLLEQQGATVIATASGSEALQALDRSLPDVIVSDIGMAEIDGYALMQQIRSRPPTQGRTIPAISLTAYAAEIDQKKALQSGYQKHLTKPLEPEQLVNAIVSLLNAN